MKKLILLIPLLMLFACASEPRDPIELNVVQSSSGMVAFATLSDSNDVVESAFSVVNTRLAQYRYNAASLLGQKRITIDRAKLARQRASSIQAYLDNAVKEKNLLKIQSANKQVTGAAKQLEQGI